MARGVAGVLIERLVSGQFGRGVHADSYGDDAKQLSMSHSKKRPYDTHDGTMDTGNPDVPGLSPGKPLEFIGGMGGDMPFPYGKDQKYWCGDATEDDSVKSPIEGAHTMSGEKHEPKGETIDKSSAGPDTEFANPSHMKPGGGGRFAKLKAKLSSRAGVKNPGALAAWIGRKKYGKKKMGKWSAAGRKRAAGR